MTGVPQGVRGPVPGLIENPAQAAVFGLVLLVAAAYGRWWSQ